MVVPDSAAWALVATNAGGIFVWALRSFINQEAGPKGSTGNTGAPGKDAPEITIRVYKQLADLLISQLNGRYMMADEARHRLQTLEVKLDVQGESLNKLIERLDVEKEG